MHATFTNELRETTKDACLSLTTATAVKVPTMRMMISNKYYNGKKVSYK